MNERPTLEDENEGVIYLFDSGGNKRKMALTILRCFLSVSDRCVFQASLSARAKEIDTCGVLNSGSKTLGEDGVELFKRIGISWRHVGFACSVSHLKSVAHVIHDMNGELKRDRKRVLVEGISRKCRETRIEPAGEELMKTLYLT